MMPKSYFPTQVLQSDDDEFILAKAWLIRERLCNVAASHCDLIDWERLISDQGRMTRSQAASATESSVSLDALMGYGNRLSMQA